MHETLERKGPPPLLPLPWVQRILAKLTVRYGTSFTSRWTGVRDVDLWQDWAEVLAGYDANPGAISYALEHLPPDFPPTAVAFRDLCRLAPLPEFKALPAPVGKPDPAMVAQARGAVIRPPDYDPKAWAYRLAEREADGANLTLAQRTMWRSALNVDPTVSARRFLQPSDETA